MQSSSSSKTPLTTPLLPQRSPRPPTGSGWSLSSLFGQSGAHGSSTAIQRNEAWLEKLGVDPESRAIVSQQQSFQQALSALLEPQPAIVELRQPVGGETRCDFVKPGPTRDSLERLVRVGQLFLRFNIPSAAQLLATACEAARDGFPEREVALLRDCGLAMQNSKARLPAATLMALCTHASELIARGLMAEEDGLLFEAAACRSPDPACAAHGLRLGLWRLQAAFKALSDRPAQQRQPEVLKRLGREIDGLYRRCCTLEQPDRATLALQLMTDLVALAQDSPVHEALSTSLRGLTDIQQDFFEARWRIAAWYPDLLEGDRLSQAPQTGPKPLDASSEPADPASLHQQLCSCLSALMLHGPDRPWAHWARHLRFAQQAFPQQHDVGFDTGLCLNWVCAHPAEAGARLPSLLSCLASAPDPRTALTPQDTERLVEVLLHLPAEEVAQAFETYLGTVHGAMSAARVHQLKAVLDAHRQLDGGMAPQQILDTLVDRLGRGGLLMPRIPEWDMLTRRLLARLLARDRSPAMAQSQSLRRFLTNCAVAAREDFPVLDSTIELMCTLVKAVQASASAPCGAGTQDPGVDFCSLLMSQLQTPTGSGGQQASTANGRIRHAEQLMVACLTALRAPLSPERQEPGPFVTFSDVYASLVRTRLAQQRQPDDARAQAKLTTRLLKAARHPGPSALELDRCDPSWRDYSQRLKVELEALKKAPVGDRTTAPRLDLPSLPTASPVPLQHTASERIQRNHKFLTEHLKIKNITTLTIASQTLQEVLNELIDPKRLVLEAHYQGQDYHFKLHETSEKDVRNVLAFGRFLLEHRQRCAFDLLAGTVLQLKEALDHPCMGALLQACAEALQQVATVDESILQALQATVVQCAQRGVVPSAMLSQFAPEAAAARRNTLLRQLGASETQCQQVQNKRHLRQAMDELLSRKLPVLWATELPGGSWSFSVPTPSSGNGEALLSVLRVARGLFDLRIPRSAALLQALARSAEPDAKIEAELLRIVGQSFQSAPTGFARHLLKKLGDRAHARALSGALPPEALTGFERLARRERLFPLQSRLCRLRLRLELERLDTVMAPQEREPLVFSLMEDIQAAHPLLRQHEADPVDSDQLDGVTLMRRLIEILEKDQGPGLDEAKKILQELLPSDPQ